MAAASLPAVAMLAAVGAGGFVAPAPAAAAVPGREPPGRCCATTWPGPRPTCTRRVTTVAGRRPLTRVRTVLPVLGHARSADGRTWVHVALPGRRTAARAGSPPTGRGPRRRDGASPQARGARVTVYYSAMLSGGSGRSSVRARRARRGATSSSRRPSHSVRGTPAVPTPWPPAHAPKCFRSSMVPRPDRSARDGQSPGQRARDRRVTGCVRLGTRAITWLARRIGAGVPLTVGR